MEYDPLLPPLGDESVKALILEGSGLFSRFLAFGKVIW